MSDEIEFYICQMCFRTSEKGEVCHSTMIPVVSGKPGDSRRKPIKNNYGKYFSRAPMWYHQSSSPIALEEVIKHHDEWNEDK